MEEEKLPKIVLTLGPDLGGGHDLVERIGVPREEHHPPRTRVLLVFRSGESLIGVFPQVPTLATLPCGLHDLNPHPCGLDRSGLDLFGSLRIFTLNPPPLGHMKEVAVSPSIPGGSVDVRLRVLVHGKTHVIVVVLPDLNPVLQELRKLVHRDPTDVLQLLGRIPRSPVHDPHLKPCVGHGEISS